MEGSTRFVKEQSGKPYNPPAPVTTETEDKLFYFPRFVAHSNCPDIEGRTEMRGGVGGVVAPKQ